MKYIFHNKVKYLAKPQVNDDWRSNACSGCFFDDNPDHFCPEDKNEHFKCIRPRGPNGSSQDDVIFIENTPEAIAAYIARRLT